jgi:hypothetical protein
LKQPAQVVSASRSETASRFWVVPDSYASVLAAIKGSEQSGQAYNGSGESRQRGTLLSGSAMFGPLVLSLAPLPDGTTGVRADAQVLWSPTRTPAQQVGDVVSVVATAYRQDLGHTLRQQTVSGQQAQHLAALVDGLSIAQDVGRSCVADFGGRQQLDFTRADNTHVVVDGFFCGGVTLQAPDEPLVALDLSPGLVEAVNALVPLPAQ